jgi:DnaJ-class molecular chaperone
MPGSARIVVVVGGDPTPVYISNQWESSMADCPTCGGTGKVMEDDKEVDCKTCGGTGEYEASTAVKEPPKD